MKQSEAARLFGSLFVDGDFDPEEPVECKDYCSPTCHPMQVGPEWVYGCRNEKHPGFDPSDFVPIVNCEGKLSKCEIRKGKAA